MKTGLFLKLFLGCLILLPAGLKAQSLIKGKIVDSNNGEGLAGASLSINDSIVSACDRDGKFELKISSFPASIQVNFIGYEKKMISISNAGDYVIRLTATPYMLGEVVVTAYETNQKIKDVAGSISLITHKNLEVDNEVNIVQALNRVPGIYMQSGTYNTNRLTIRGIGSRSLFGTSKIRAYYSNIPLTTGDGETTIEDIDPSLIDRIEIIKGPSSSIYGAGLGGTLLISPFSSNTSEKRFEYQLSGGSYGLIKNSLMAEAGFKKSAIRIGFDKISSDGYRENNHFNRSTVGISAVKEIREKTSLLFILNYIDLLGQIPSSLDLTTYNYNPRSAAPAWKAAEGYEDYNKLLTGFNVERQIGRNSNFDAGIFWSTRNSYERRPFNILKEDTRAGGLRFKYSYSGILLKNKISLVLGYEYFQDRYAWTTTENQNKKEGALLSDNLENRRNMNLFVKADYVLPTKTIISAGVNLNSTDYRYQDIYSIDSVDNSGSYSFGKIWSPRIGISQPVTGNFNLYASLSHGFSPPSLSETLTPIGNINPDIQPETGINYEAGGRGFIAGRKLYVDLSVFSLQVKNLLVARRTGDDQFIGVNAGKTSHKGLEFTLNYDFTGGGAGNLPHIIGYFTYTYSNFRFKEFVDDTSDYSGNKLTGVPRNQLNAGINLSLNPGFYGNLNYQFVDEMPVNDGNSIFTDPYQIVNARIGFKHNFRKHFSADAWAYLNNIFNEKYASMIQVNALSTGGRSPRYYYPGLPRNYALGLKISYFFF
jgi:iron complex outermembrane receptor protein